MSSILTTLPLLVLLAFVALGQQSAKSIAIEKETNLKEYMLMMGLSRTTLWTSWYIHFMILSLFPVCIGTIILCAKISPNGAILAFSSPGIIFIYLFIWAQSLITLGFLISTWFKESAFTRCCIFPCHIKCPSKTSNVTAAMSIVCIFAFYLPFFGLSMHRNPGKEAQLLFS